jgi:hypothetical protein
VIPRRESGAWGGHRIGRCHGHREKRYGASEGAGVTTDGLWC